MKFNIIYVFLMLIIVFIVTPIIINEYFCPVEVKQERKIILTKQKGDFFTVGRYGRTIILEVNTERTNGEQKSYLGK